MASTKRTRPEADDFASSPSSRYFTPTLTPTPTPSATQPPTKRRRVLAPVPALPRLSGCDLLSPLSDELLLRILSFLSPQHLLAVAPVSHRFYHLSADSQLWKALYYARFVLPRAMRIPGFRDGAAAGLGVGGSGAGHKLHFAGRRTLWADGRRGGVAREHEEGLREAGKDEVDVAPRTVDWMRQYKIRYNWARGKCAVEELKLGDEIEADGAAGRKMLVKVVEGVAVTADRAEGLRAWDLRSRSMLAQMHIAVSGSDAAPSCITVDEAELGRGMLDVALGFTDGSFGLWRLLTHETRFETRYRHEKSTNGELVAMALLYPYLLTATKTVLVSLYTFEIPSSAETGQGLGRGGLRAESTGAPGSPAQAGSDVQTSQQLPVSRGVATHRQGAGKLPAPYLLTSLDSHTSRPPLALSIRKAGMTTIASVAYTFSTRRGWSIGIQDLHIHQPATDAVQAAPEIMTTRIAFTTPLEISGSVPSLPTPPATPLRRRDGGPSGLNSSPTSSHSDSEALEPGPTTLCYTHPYLLATLPDNTLVLHMCTSTASSLTISDGIRLWGHTSGISDAEITARGKAVSVSTRGEEMRVWELEGRSGAGAGSRSVEIRPWQAPGRRVRGDAASEAGGHAGDYDGLHLGDPARAWDERRNWVGFDDEMVIVLKERQGARESLMVYDFT